MDETVAEFIRRTILKIPKTEIMTILKGWDFLSENQLQTVNFQQNKESLIQHLILLCEEKHASFNDVALLDMIYTQVHRHQKVWNVFQMSKEPGQDVDLFDRKQFKSSFKKILQRALEDMMVSFRDTEENAVWIRIAWGTQYTKPKQYKPTYVVYYPQTPYAFASFSSLRSNIPLLGQTFEMHNSTTPLQERSLGLNINMDSRIIHENILEKERVQRITQETFGDYPQPQLEFAQYKLETKFKSDLNGGILAEREEPLRCLIKFSSPHLLEALKSLAPAGIADAPLSPLLTCIPSKRMNYFKIRDK
ncbi:PREDICTED: centromere protein N [Galeopterus variegatus]|uniref:Centromere protein N n=1 Tax=Galeopterus variegatus TaxID=482537 RepID=A0ABM0RVA2_GALVR|nr:PREDICTED: centromere protein N [Galeopterus variegatus]